MRVERAEEAWSHPPSRSYPLVIIIIISKMCMYVCDGVTVKKENRASSIESLVSSSDDHLAYMSRGNVSVS